MKLFTLLILLLCFATFNMAQEAQAPRQNVLSNVLGITLEGGATLGFTDYNKNKINYNGKGSLEYYIPSSGKGNFGLRAFAQTGFVSGQEAPQSVVNPTDEFSTKIDIIGGGVFYTLSLSDIVYPWVAVGVSNIWFYPKDADGNQLPNHLAGNFSTYMLGYNGDLGVRFMVSKSMSFNINAGIIVGSRDFLDDIKTGPNNDLLYTGNAGLTYYFGTDKDSDRDGVPDSKDACPNTPVNVKVDINGCPLDSDNDGVLDYQDKCTNTPVNVKVDANGCPLDSDGDGVADYLDKCTNTPANVKVDENGCPVDSDKDGIPDYQDKCPNTLVGVPVNSDGCPIKKDTVIIKQPAEIESLVLSGDTNFEFNKAELLPSAYTVLDSLVSTMKKHPDYKWEIAGHTDGIGSASYNKKLSEQRAQAVVEFLAGRGVDRNKLTIVGYGKDRPIATNDTPEGRSMNRRVEIKLLSKK